MQDLATWVLDGFTLALIVVAILTFGANWKSARASEESAKAARNLYELEQAEYRRREESERPNLQLYHAYILKPDQESPTTSSDPPIYFDFMNFGDRPAKISAAKLDVSGRTYNADPRTTTCVCNGEIVRLQAHTNHADIKKAFFEAITGLKPQLQGGGESLLHRANDPNNISDEYRKVTITIIYSETDGTNERTVPFTFNTPLERAKWSHNPLSMRVLHDAKEAERGDLPY